MTDQGDTPEVHIAGLAVMVGPRLRQRCGWCGALIDDTDLRHVAVATPTGSESTEYPTWPLGSFVAVLGAARWTVEHVDGDPVPAGSCARIDHEVTA